LLGRRFSREVGGFRKRDRSPLVAPDALQQHPKAADVVEVVDRMTLSDDSGEVRLYNVANPHVYGMLIGYIVNDGLVWGTDMYSPARDQRKSPGAVDLYKTLKRLGIEPSPTFPTGALILEFCRRKLNLFKGR
jgi:hypothetical protein